jgi:hypothetical protein
MDVNRPALRRGLAAFGAVWLVGSALVFGLRSLASDRPSGDTPSPTGATSPSPEPSLTPQAYLAWVPGGFPRGFGDGLERSRSTADITIATADNVWMVRSFNEAGRVKEDPRGGSTIPIDATGVDPDTFAPFLPEDAAAIVGDLDDAEGILSRTSARLRGIGIGGQLEFDDGIVVRIGAVLPDELIGGYELLVTRSTGEQIGIQHDRYAIFLPAGDEPPSVRDLQREFRELIPRGSPFRVVQVRAPGEARFLRMSDLILPPALLKREFGEFAARPSSVDPGALDIEGRWVRKNIEVDSVPLLGRIQCHRKLIPLVRSAMAEVRAEGLGNLVRTYSGCYAPRTTLGAPGASISHHAWGAAIDINAPDSPFGEDPSPRQARLAEIMERWGFVWGGRFIVPDPHHFEWIGPPQEPEE